MEHGHVVHIDLEKEEYDEASPQYHQSPQDAHRPAPAAAPKSCIFCRKTLLLSYFNCCAICLSVIECGRARKHDGPPTTTLPTVEPRPPLPSLHLSREVSARTSSSSSSVTAVEETSNSNSGGETRGTPRHCGYGYCKYTHLRPVLTAFVVCEIIHLIGALTALNMALYWHDWLLLRFAGLLFLQWWQIYMLSRQWHCGQSIAAGQVAAAFFMVWYYVESSQNWRWWEPLAICSVLLKIVFPW